MEPSRHQRSVAVLASQDWSIRMTSRFPSADEYSTQIARYPALTVVDIRAEQAEVTESYRNQVLVDVNSDCVRLAVFEGEYRWHHHPDSDELFLVVAGTLQIDLAGGKRIELAEWQSVVIPAGMVHRTRAIGRTVNITCEKKGAQTVFVEPPP
jgi:mannose-6-phosphate isomerase-like protein (cupin superfamily)